MYNNYSADTLTCPIQSVYLRYLKLIFILIWQWLKLVCTVYPNTLSILIQKISLPASACQIPQVSLYMTHISMYDCGKHSLVTSFNKLISYTCTLLKLLTKIILCLNSYQMETSTILRKQTCIHVLMYSCTYSYISLKVHFHWGKSCAIQFVCKNVFKKSEIPITAHILAWLLYITRYIITNKNKLMKFLEN